MRIRKIINRLIYFVLVAFLTSACAPSGPSRYELQRQELKNAYLRGDLTANDYYARANELAIMEQQEEAQKKANTAALGMMLMGLGAQNLSRQQAPAPATPRIGTGTITTYGPGGGTTFYNYTEH